MAELSTAERSFLDWLSCFRARPRADRGLPPLAATPTSRTAMVGATGLTADRLNPMLDKLVDVGYVERQPDAIYSILLKGQIDGYVITEKGLEALRVV